MASINSIATASPPFSVEKAEMKDVSERWLAGNPEMREKFLRIAQGSGVAKRHFVLPYKDILQFGGLAQRAKLFEEFGAEILADVINRALTQFDGDPREISHIIFSSCSVPVIPSIDAKAILNTPLSANISRVPIFQQGCAGGVVGIKLGSQLARTGQPVLVASVELCSLVFQPNNLNGEQLVGAAIFADGAAATVVTPGSGKLEILDSLSSLIPQSRHLMGYDIFDDGFHLRLDRHLPSALIEAAPRAVADFLARSNLQFRDIDYWLFHPGGKKILEFFVDKFELAEDQLRWSVDVLRDFGNMSSTTIFFVIDSFLESGALQRGQKALVVGIGPGLTLELILLEGR